MLCRGTVLGAPPSPYTRPQECPKIGLKKRTWCQARRHVCAKARLRNPDCCFFLWAFCVGTVRMTGGFRSRRIRPRQGTEKSAISGCSLHWIVFFNNYHCHHKHYRPENFLSELFPAILDRIITGKYAKRINLIVIRAHYRKHLAVHRSHDTRTEIP